MNIYDIIVVGLGSHGSACFDHLSTKFKVLGIEQFVSPHNRGTHNGETRLVRDSWYIEPEYCQMGKRAMELWRQLQQSTDTPIFVNSGSVCFGNLSDQYYQASFSPDQKPKNMSNEEFQTRFNIISNGLEFIQHDPNSGYIIPETAIATFLKRGVKKGGTIVNNCKYIKHEYKDGCTLVYTDQEIYKCKKLLLTLGVGLKQVQSYYPFLKLEMQKQQVIFLECNNKKYENLPIFLSEQNAKVIYGFSPVNNQIKMGIHWFGPELVYPELYDHCQNPDFTINTIRTFLKKFMPELSDNKVIRTQTCIYANTPDKHFIIDFDPNNRDTILLSACSGHGFKFSIAMGEIVEEMFETGKPKFKLFELSRFLLPKL